ncbi:MAG: alpha/beta hydrolase [Clostridiales bacterium]|nr:alpha/beta hydrolase [Clostridiales bacterium]
MENIYYPSKDGKNTIHACIWRPVGEIKGAVQIIHGMAEYAERYSPFAEFLAENGYLVCAEDHLGHGKSAKSEEDLGYFCDQRDIEIVISDIRELQLLIQEKTGTIPYFVLGHSMGSFFCRAYISMFGTDVSGAIVMGSGFKGKPLLNTALFMVNLNALFKGWRNRSKFINNLAFGGYNKKIKPVKTENDWLSVNPENVDIYQADPLCGYKFTNNGYKILFSIIKRACSSKTIKSTPKVLPVLLVAGEDDPVGDYGKGVLKTHQKFKAAGIKDLSVKLYSNSRHEILNDYCKDEVYKDILVFLNSHI